MTEARINELVAQLWGLLVASGATWGDATEIIGRLLISLSMARAGGDRAKAVLDLKQTTLGIIEAAGDPEAQFHHTTTNDTGKGVSTVGKKKQKPKPGKRPAPSY